MQQTPDAVAVAVAPHGSPTQPLARITAPSPLVAAPSLPLNTVQQHLHRPRLPLVAVTAACSPRAIPDSVASAISSFIARKRWTVKRACKLGDLQLLQCVIAVESACTHPVYCADAFGKALVQAVKHEHALALAKCLTSYCPTGLPGKSVATAASHGKLDVIKWLFSNHSKFVWSNTYADEAATGGHLKVLQWIKQHSPDVEGDLAGAVGQAPFSGDLATVKWLYENVSPAAITADIHVDAFDAAVENGNLEIVKYIVKQYQQHAASSDPEWPSHPDSSPLNTALCHGKLEIAKWFYEHGCREVSEEGFVLADRADVGDWLVEISPNESTCYAVLMGAVQRGDLDVVKRLHSRFADENRYNETLTIAASSGHLHVVQWLFHHLRNDCRNPSAAESDSLDEAAGNGHFEIVKWLHARQAGTGLPRFTVSEAVANNHFEIAKWLVASSDQADFSDDGERDVRKAAVAGDLEMIKWLCQDMGAKCTPEAMDSAYCFLDLLKWFHENSPVGCTTEAMDSAAEYGRLDAVQWLHENRTEGCTTNALDKAAENGHLHVVKWLHENRTEGGTEYAMDHAASLEIVEWLHKHRSDGCSTDAMDNAVENGGVDTLLFLHEYRTEGCTIQAAVRAHMQGYMDIFEWLVATYPDVMELDKIREVLDDDLTFYLSTMREGVKRLKCQRVS